MFLTNSAPGPRGRDRACASACVTARVTACVLAGARRRGSDGDTPLGFVVKCWTLLDVISAGSELEVHSFIYLQDFSKYIKMFHATNDN